MQETVTESGQRLRVIETALALLLVLLLLAATFRVLLPLPGSSPTQLLLPRPHQGCLIEWLIC